MLVLDASGLLNPTSVIISELTSLDAQTSQYSSAVIDTGRGARYLPARPRIATQRDATFLGTVDNTQAFVDVLCDFVGAPAGVMTSSIYGADYRWLNDPVGGAQVHAEAQAYVNARPEGCGVVWLSYGSWAAMRYAHASWFDALARRIYGVGVRPRDYSAVVRQVAPSLCAVSFMPTTTSLADVSRNASTILQVASSFPLLPQGLGTPVGTFCDAHPWLWGYEPNSGSPSIFVKATTYELGNELIARGAASSSREAALLRQLGVSLQQRDEVILDITMTQDDAKPEVLLTPEVAESGITAGQLSTIKIGSRTVADTSTAIASAAPRKMFIAAVSADSVASEFTVTVNIGADGSVTNARTGAVVTAASLTVAGVTPSAVVGDCPLTGAARAAAIQEAQRLSGLIIYDGTSRALHRNWAAHLGLRSAASRWLAHFSLPASLAQLGPIVAFTAFKSAYSLV